MLQILCEADDIFLTMLADLFNDAYDCGKNPQGWLQSTFVLVPKKSGKICDDYRLISLFNHMPKAFLKIIHRRIYSICELEETQYCFRGGFGTREAIFALQVLVHRCRDIGHNVYMCFLDYSKAFDRVQHSKLVSVLRETGIDCKDIRIRPIGNKQQESGFVMNILTRSRYRKEFSRAAFSHLPYSTFTPENYSIWH